MTTGSACTRKIWLIGTCLEVTETSCCFNSLLTKLINRQGRVQLGLSAQSCSGFSEAQILKLNFAAMDFSEFIQTMVPKPTDLPATASRVNQTVTQKVTDYYESP